MDLIALATNPLVRKILPVLGEVAAEFGPEADESKVDELIALVRRLLPFIFVLRKTSVQNASVEDISKMLAAVGVTLAPSDVELWLAEIQRHASDPTQTLQEFVTGPGGRAMLKGVLTRGTEPSPDRPAEDEVPAFDPNTGIFIFS